MLLAGLNGPDKAKAWILTNTVFRGKVICFPLKGNFPLIYLATYQLCQGHNHHRHWGGQFFRLIQLFTSFRGRSVSLWQSLAFLTVLTPVLNNPWFGYRNWKSNGKTGLYRYLQNFTNACTHNSQQFPAKINTSGIKSPTTIIYFHTNYYYEADYQLIKT